MALAYTTLCSLLHGQKTVLETRCYMVTAYPYVVFLGTVVRSYGAMPETFLST